MDRLDINRCAFRTIPAALALTALLVPAAGWAWALCFGASALWGAANLFCLGLVLDAVVLHRRVVPGLIAVQIKLAVLFGGLAAIALSPFFTPSAFLAGFHTVFAVILATMARGLFRAPVARREAV